MTLQVAVENDTPSAMLDRVSLVLDAFEGPGRLTLAQIVRRTGLPRSSAHRMLERLVSLRWLRREGRDYALGMRLVELGSLAVHQDRLHAAAIAHLHELHRATGLVVHLAVLDGSDVVYLEKLGGRLAAAVPTRVGGRLPARRCALGKALLAFSGAPGADFEQIRNRGVACERQESLPGFGCIAAPVGPAGSAVAAVSVCGPMQHMTFDHRLAGPVRMTATAIWRGVDRHHVTPTLQRRNPLRSAPTAPRLQYA